MKVIVILLGLMMAVGAIGLAGYRHGYVQTMAVQSRTAPEPGGLRAAYPRPGPQAPRPAPGHKVSTFQVFEVVLNVLNVVVGIAGIFLAIIGMRMHRAASAMAQERQ